MDPYYSDDSVTLYHGDALATLRALPDASVNCCVTSPPYFGLRDYGEDGQYGLESSPAEYVETMRAVFAEVRRVLANDGTLWLNIGDSYNAGKNLLGIPWRTAFALQDDGWTLRNAIVWHKSNGMPDPAADRFRPAHELVFLMTKQPRYWFDLAAVKVPGKDWTRGGPGVGITPTDHYGIGNGGNGGLAALAQRYKDGTQPSDKNPGDVWSFPTVPFSGAHFATMPNALAERCVMAGCRPGGVVLDPFSGSGTTGLAANKHGRRYVGIDLNRTYLDLSVRTRFAQQGLMLGEESA